MVKKVFKSGKNILRVVDHLVLEWPQNIRVDKTSWKVRIYEESAKSPARGHISNSNHFLCTFSFLGLRGIFFFGSTKEKLIFSRGGQLWVGSQLV